MIEIKTQRGDDGKPRTVAQALAEAEREPFFSIDGQEYTIPVEGAVPPALGLQALDRARHEGAPAAEVWAMEQLVGAAAWRALRTCPDITADQMRAIMKIIRDRALGPVELDEGKDA